MRSLILVAPLLPVVFAYALPESPAPPVGIAIQRRAPSTLSSEDRLATKIMQHRLLKGKYGLPQDDEVELALAKRGAVGTLDLAGNDQSYYGSISIGTPAKTYEVVLDTGSSDLVLATVSTNLCGTICTTTAPLYSVAGSSSAQDSQAPFTIKYGTGQASGTLVRDQVSLAGFSASQVFGACDDISSLTTSSDQTGLLGLAWKTIANSKATPFVQALWSNNSLSNPVFGFGVRQLDSTDVPDATSVVSGGYLTIGDVNSTLFTGKMNYISLSNAGAYWNIPLSNVAVQGTTLGVNSSAAVIDTGTNSLALPADVAASIYAAIPNSQVIPQSGGLYAFPCSTAVNLVLTFGGIDYPMLSKDFNGGPVNRAGTLCVGAVSSLGSAQQNAPPWIIGTPFLMSYYSAYRFDPPAVGFATMATSSSLFKGPIPTSSGDNSSPAVSAAPSSPSVGSGSASGSGSGSGSGTSGAGSGGSSSGAAGVALGPTATMVLGLALFITLFL